MALGDLGSLLLFSPPSPCSPAREHLLQLPEEEDGFLHRGRGWSSREGKNETFRLLTLLPSIPPGSGPCQGSLLEQLPASGCTAAPEGRKARGEEHNSLLR